MKRGCCKGCPTKGFDSFGKIGIVWRNPAMPIFCGLGLAKGVFAGLK